MIGQLTDVSFLFCLKQTLEEPYFLEHLVTSAANTMASPGCSQKQNLCKAKLGKNGECIIKYNICTVRHIKTVVQFYGIEREVPA